MPIADMPIRGLLFFLALLTLAAVLVIVLLERDNIPQQEKVGFRRAASFPPKEALTQSPSAPFSSLPSADAQCSELPVKSARSSMGVVLPPAFATSIFNAETEDDPALVVMQDRITAARDTFSEEGLAILAPMLAHPRAQVRAEALDAMLQMELPSAGKILRDAARNASSEEERRRLDQAADFNDLPSICVEQIQKTRPPDKKAPSSNP
jgi:HEAT repeat protein